MSRPLTISLLSLYLALHHQAPKHYQSEPALGYHILASGGMCLPLDQPHREAFDLAPNRAEFAYGVEMRQVLGHGDWESERSDDHSDDEDEVDNYFIEETDDFEDDSIEDNDYDDDDDDDDDGDGDGYDGGNDDDDDDDDDGNGDGEGVNEIEHEDGESESGSLEKGQKSPSRRKKRNGDNFKLLSFVRAS